MPAIIRCDFFGTSQGKLSGQWARGGRHRIPCTPRSAPQLQCYRLPMSIYWLSISPTDFIKH